MRPCAGAAAPPSDAARPSRAPSRAAPATWPRRPDLGPVRAPRHDVDLEGDAVEPSAPPGADGLQVRPRHGARSTLSRARSSTRSRTWSGSTAASRATAGARPASSLERLGSTKRNQSRRKGSARRYAVRLLSWSEAPKGRSRRTSPSSTRVAIGRDRDVEGFPSRPAISESRWQPAPTSASTESGWAASRTSSRSRRRGSSWRTPSGLRTSSSRAGSRARYSAASSQYRGTPPQAGEGLDRAHVVAKGEGLLDPTGGQRGNPEDLAGAPEERRRAVEDQPLHEPLRRAGQEETRTAAAAPVEDLLEDGGKGPVGGHERGELVEGERGAARGVAPPAGQKGFPVRVADVAETRDEAADLDGERGPLQDALPVVAHVVDRSSAAECLVEKPRLPAPAAAVKNGESSLRPPQEGPEAGLLLGTVEEGQAHAHIMQLEHYV